MYVEQYEIIIRIGVIKLQGRLEAQDAAELRKRLEDHSANGVSSVLVDLQRVNFIDNQCVTALVAGMKLLRGRGGDLRLVGLQPGPRSVFELMMLDKVFQIFETQEEALRGL